MKNIKIGNTTIAHGLMLAPMAGFTDFAFRKICREHGAEYTVSEMVSAKALCYEQIIKKSNESVYKTAPLARVRADELPMAIQLFGSEPEYVARAAEMIEQRCYKACTSDAIPTAIDINMGCPMHKIVGNGEGSALMKNPSLAAEIVRATSGALSNIPVTVKIRAGWDGSSKNAAEVARAVESAGAALICVHARTREQMYNPGIDLSIIEEVKKAVSVPVIGNGDIRCAKDALGMMDRTGCDGVMIGRGALGNPWIFEEISCALDGREYIAPTLSERLDTCIRHIRVMREQKGEQVGGAEIKKQAALYITGIRGAAAIRDSIMRAQTALEIEKLIEGLYGLDGGADNV